MHSITANINLREMRLTGGRGSAFALGLESTSGSLVLKSRSLNEPVPEGKKESVSRSHVPDVSGIPGFSFCLKRPNREYK